MCIRDSVGAGDAVDHEVPLAALGEEAQVDPQARRLDQHLGSRLEHERLVAGDVEVPAQAVGDVGIDVVLRGP